MTAPADLEKQAKDAVTAALAAGTTGAAAAAIVCQHIAHAARLSKEPKDGVVAVCRGAMSAFLLGGQDLSVCAVALMEALPNISLMMRAGPEDLMSWVMEGIADVIPVAGPEVKNAVSARIEEKFMGASQIFDGFCDAARKRAGG